MSGEVVGGWMLDLARATAGDKYIASPAEMLQKLLLMVLNLVLRDINAIMYFVPFSTTNMHYIPQASNWAHDASVGEFFTSVLFIKLSVYLRDPVKDRSQTQSMPLVLGGHNTPTSYVGNMGKYDRSYFG